MFKNIINNGLKGLKSTRFNNTIVRNFSAKNNLITAFTNELNFEENEYKPISEEEKKVFFKNTNFEFIESNTSPKMELKKSVNDFLVCISYVARAPIPASEEESQQEQGDQEPGSMTDFQVLIQKEGQISGFMVDAVVIDGQININHVHVADNVQEFHAKYLSGKVNADVYDGPDFQSLDENLQVSFVDFISELGVTEEAAAFIEVTSLDKDQSLYMGWLNQCKNNLL